MDRRAAFLSDESTTLSLSPPRPPSLSAPPPLSLCPPAPSPPLSLSLARTRFRGDSLWLGGCWDTWPASTGGMARTCSARAQLLIPQTFPHLCVSVTSPARTNRAHSARRSVTRAYGTVPGPTAALVLRTTEPLSAKTTKAWEEGGGGGGGEGDKTG